MRSFTGRLFVNFAILTWLAQICSLGRAQSQVGAGEKALPAGQVIESIRCAADPTQDYALYLPSTYNAAKAWPIIYTFDPEARGKIPVRLYKDVAEKYGFILAASNTSRNFQTEGFSKAAQSIWEDTHARLHLDARRIYLMGFSGGARVATALALRCDFCAVAGVIAHGAGYPDSVPPTEKDHFAYLAFVGDKDFNWPELIDLRRKKEAWGSSFRLTVYDGEHQWAPPAILEEGVEWLQLKAMRAGMVPTDQAFVDRLFARAQKRAEDAARSNDAIAEFEAYRSLASDFGGLKEVSQYQAKLTALKNSAELKQTLKKEQDAIDEQRADVRELSQKLSQAAEASSDAQIALRTEIVDGMAGLRNKAKQAKNEDARLICQRAFDQLWVQGIEAGQAELEIRKQLSKAEFYFQLMSSVTPDRPWPVLLLAETSALRGDKKRALKELHEAVKRGLQHAESIEEDANLQTLRLEPEFQRIVAELRARQESQAAQ